MMIKPTWREEAAALRRKQSRGRVDDGSAGT